MIALGLAGPVLAQKVNLTGSWKGVLTQRPEGVASEYDFELYLIQDGDKIRGRSYVTYKDYHAELEIEGEVFRDKGLVFQETRFVSSSELDPNLIWCVKMGQMQIKQEEGVWKLDGIWQGRTDEGPCIPGEIHLVKVEPQA